MDFVDGAGLAAGGFAALSGFSLAKTLIKRHGANCLRSAALLRSGASQSTEASRYQSLGLAGVILNYLSSLERRLAHGATQSVAGWLPRPSNRSAMAFEQRVRYAGIKGALSQATMREASARLGFLGFMVGVLVGICLSNELGALLGVAGLVLGARGPSWALGQEERARSAACKRELPELLEVVSLGLSSGLTFDRSFSLYHTHFDTGFARSCASAQRKWTMGLSTREEALRDLAAGYDSALLKRVVDNVVRSMKFGTSLAADLEKAALDSQAEQRAARQEEVAKAPVKMMVPTATLILPAMLMLVLGPVLLELINGF